MLRRIACWGPFVIACVGAAALWGPRLGRPLPHPDADPTADELAAEAAESPTTLVVDFVDGVGAAALADNGLDEEPISAYSATDRLYRVRFRTADDARQAYERLRHDPAVESVDYDVAISLSPDESLRAQRSIPSAPGCAVPAKSREPGGSEAQRPKFPDDPCYAYQWHLGQIGLPSAWTRGQGAGAVVAVIDTGVSRVPDLEGTEFVPGYDFVHNRADASDDHGHGTHVAGTIAQATNNGIGVAGVAFGAKIMPLKVLSAQGSGSMAAIAQSIRWAADHGANVINMSLGGPLPVNTIKSAVKYARDKGVTVIAAAGNDGRGRVSYPAKYPGVLAVAATQYDESPTFYSNWGGEIDIAAPGGNVRVDQNNDGLPDGVLQNTIVPGDISRNDYLLFMGTSMATPHVAGVAALLVGAGVTQPEAVERLLLSTAKHPSGNSAAGGSLGGSIASLASQPSSSLPAARRQHDGRIDDHYGAGIVNAERALAKAKTAGFVGGPLLASALAFGSAFARRQRRRLGVGFASPASPIVGGPGLAASSPLAFGASLLLGAGALLVAPGNPLVASALVPAGAIALLWGVRRMRPAIAGLAFGFAGALVLAAITGFANVRFVPDFMDRAWLVVNAAVAFVVARIASSVR